MAFEADIITFRYYQYMGREKFRLLADKETQLLWVELFIGHCTEFHSIDMP